jgi:hypothetical protein
MLKENSGFILLPEFTDIDLLYDLRAFLCDVNGSSKGLSV